MCKVIEDMRREEREEGRMEGLKQGLEQGLEQGLRKGVVAAALRMLGTGKYLLEEIADISGLSLSEVKELQAGQST